MIGRGDFEIFQSSICFCVTLVLVCGRCLYFDSQYGDILVFTI